MAREPRRSDTPDVDVTALAFAQYVTELKSQASSSHHQLHAEIGAVRNRTTGSLAELRDFKRNSTAVQQQMQAEISALREALSAVFAEITSAVRSGSEADHDLKLNFQTLDEQLIQNDTLITQLSESAELSQVQMQEFVRDLQSQAERVRDELQALKTFATDLETSSQERAAALQQGVSELAKQRAMAAQERTHQVGQMRQETSRVLESLQGLHADLGEHRKDSTTTQNRIQQGIFQLDESRRLEDS